MLILTEEDVQRLLPMKEAVRLMREAFEALGRGEAVNQPRRRLILPTGAVLHQMAASFRNYFGTKIYSTHVKHGANFTFLLYDAATAKPLAQMDANYLGQIRTGAASGLAADLMAPKEAATAGLIGSGFQTWTQLEALLAVRPIRSVKVWSRSQERRTDFAERASIAFQVQVVPVDTAEAAVRGAELIATATFAKEPVMDSAWVASGAHINAAGANMANRREAPSELLDRARLIAVDAIDAARIEAGDLLLAKPAERWGEWPLVELGKLAIGEPWPPSAGDVTVFKSVGLAVEDVAAGGFVFEQAMRQMGWERGEGFYS
jgi:ornithine cyclodeaminase/alanine dehydrogenase-like protein (mu-crystallin family)